MANVSIVPILDELVEKRRLSKINVFGSAVQEVIPPTLHASADALPFSPSAEIYVFLGQVKNYFTPI